MGDCNIDAGMQGCMRGGTERVRGGTEGEGEERVQRGVVRDAGLEEEEMGADDELATEDGIEEAEEEEEEVEDDGVGGCRGVCAAGVHAFCEVEATGSEGDDTERAEGGIEGGVGCVAAVYKTEKKRRSK